MKVPELSVNIPPARTIVGITLRVMHPRHAERDDYGDERPGRRNKLIPPTNYFRTGSFRAWPEP